MMKMKILIAFYPIDDMGGIINHTEHLTLGLRELGHEVTARLLVWKEQAPRSMAGGHASDSALGLKYDQRSGYSWPAAGIFPYKGKKNLEQWLDFSSNFDLIIWQVPVPTKRKENRGNMDWLSLYNTSARQVAVIHDGNFLASYPWLYFVRDRLAGLACVHNCAMNSAQNISTPSALIYNPFKVKEPDISRGNFNSRLRGFLSVQTWKAWKRVPELLRAVPYMDPTTIKFVAGKGIDYYYLTSKDKCKYPGVWDRASVAGFNYLGVINNETRDLYLQTLTCQIDASWSKKYGAIGAHFNRVTVEAILYGCVPIVRDMGVAGSIFQELPMIPWDAGPEDFASLVDHYCNLSYEEYFSIMVDAVSHLPEFDRTTVAQKFVHLSFGLHEQKGVTSESVRLDAATAIREFFNEQ